MQSVDRGCFAIKSRLEIINVRTTACPWENCEISLALTILSHLGRARVAPAIRPTAGAAPRFSMCWRGVSSLSATSTSACVMAAMSRVASESFARPRRAATPLAASCVLIGGEPHLQRLSESLAHRRRTGLASGRRESSARAKADAVGFKRLSRHFRRDIGEGAQPMRRERRLAVFGQAGPVAVLVRPISAALALDEKIKPPPSAILRSLSVD